jgi:hypothetical protein
MLPARFCPPSSVVDETLLFGRGIKAEN